MSKPRSAALAPDSAAEAGDDRGLPEDAIYEQIHHAVARQDLAPGTRLREEELRRIFNVSRTRIRNVLTRLAYAGVVSLEPNRGASVARPTPKEAHDNFIARRAVEEAIVRLAATRVTPADLARLEANIDAECAARQAGDQTAMVWLSGEFHTLLAEIAGNTILARILRDLITREALVIATYERQGKPSCSHEEHSAILAALQRRDADTAARLMLEHLGNVEDRLYFDPPERDTDLSRIFGRLEKGGAG